MHSLPGIAKLCKQQFLQTCTILGGGITSDVSVMKVRAMTKLWPASKQHQERGIERQCCRGLSAPAQAQVCMGVLNAIQDAWHAIESLLALDLEVDNEMEYTTSMSA